jgi:hypothetical protein
MMNAKRKQNTHTSAACELIPVVCIRVTCYAQRFSRFYLKKPMSQFGGPARQQVVNYFKAILSHNFFALLLVYMTVDVPSSFC